jgi:hypothetical protein
MKKILPIAALLVLCLSPACNDDFLERYPQTEIAKENFFKSEEDLATYLYGLYDLPDVWLYVSDAATDNAATTGITEMKNMMTGNPSAENISGGWDWTRLRDINFFLENMKNADVTSEQLNHYEGVARLFRALFYMDKVKRYSDVPWYDKVLSADDPDLFKSRDSRDMVVQKVFEDFKFATEHISEDQPEGAVNRWVALAYMARNALYEGTYRKYHGELNLQASADDFLLMARDAAKDLMENGSFSLHSTGNPDSDYAALFNSTSLEDNTEVIWANHHVADLKNSNWWAFMFGNYEVSLSKDLLQAYLMKDGSFYSSQPDYEQKLFVQEFVDRDTRLYQTYAYPGFELRNIDTYSQGGGVYVQQLQKNFSGYHQLKGFVNIPDQQVFNSLDVPILRYAEVLLTYAEALAELGQLTQNDLDKSVNLVRARSGMPAMTMNPPIDPVQSERYTGSQSSQWQEILEIRRERRVEMAQEGLRFDDLMRWNAGKLLEVEPRGLYFPALGKYDLTGDGVDDIYLIPNTQSIPANKEQNSLGVPLVYYRAGQSGSDAAVYLSGGTEGYVVTVPERGTFISPKYYYRPIPEVQTELNPNLNQIFGW